MNIFKFRDQLIDEYRSYVTSFIKIADSRIRDFAESCFSKGALWPEPLIQLNPTFKPGKTVEELTGEGLLHPVCSEIFRRDKTAYSGSGATLRWARYYHCLTPSSPSHLDKKRSCIP